MTADSDGMKAIFVNATGQPAPKLEDLWPSISIVVPKEDIDAEMARLADVPRPADGRRRSLIVHPLSPGGRAGPGPGIQLSLEVLRPGERTTPIRHNSAQVVFCIQRRGPGGDRHGRERKFGTYDAGTHRRWRRTSCQRHPRAAGPAGVLERGAAGEAQHARFVDDAPNKALPQSLEQEHRLDPQPVRRCDAAGGARGGEQLTVLRGADQPAAVESKALHLALEQGEARARQARGARRGLMSAAGSTCSTTR